MRLELHRHDIGARARLRHGERADVLAADQLRQIAPLLLLVAVQSQLVDAQVRVRSIAQADGRRGPRDLLHRHRMREIAEAGAAVLGCDGEAEKAEIAQFPPQIARKQVAAVDLAGARRKALLREAPGLIAHGIDHLAQAEIELAVGGGAGHRHRTVTVTGSPL